MTHSGRRPRLVVVVANSITGDSRVQKTAIAAARAGWEVTLLGAGAAVKPEHSTLGAIHVIRLPVASTLREGATRGRRFRRLATQFGLPHKSALALYQARFRATQRRLTARMGWWRSRSDPWGRAVLRPASYALGLLVRIRRDIHTLRVKAFKWESRRGVPTRSWRRDSPYLVDLDLAFGPVLEKLRPDVVHANDITMIGVAAQSVARMRARGEQVRWLYDAHEYVQEVEWSTPIQGSAYRALERQFIRSADAVVTVSTQMAEMLQSSYRLRRLPLVVGNAPIRDVAPTSKDFTPLRQVCGLADSVPLVVYAGWISPQRGVDAVIQALPQLAGVHLALVAGRTNPALAALLDMADRLGVRDRVHVAPYVTQQCVPGYLASADVGVIPFLRRPNNEISLPTKLPEYLHAGLPVVVSDVKTVSQFVTDNGIGEVFVAGDGASAAAAIARALSNRTALASHITSDLLTELSWEHQSGPLLALYRELSGLTPVPADNVAWTAEERPGATPGGVVAFTTIVGDNLVPGWPLLTVDSPIRLGVGPANYAGQAAAFAHAVCRRDPRVSAEVFAWRTPTGFAYPANVYIDRGRLDDLTTQLESVRRAIGRYTHLLADAFLPAFGHLNGDNIENDLPALRQAGIKVALLGHGSEVRHPGHHLARHEYSLFQDAPQGMINTLTAITERNKHVAERSGLPLFVTTPDLLDDLPWATWAPLVIDVDTWACDRPIMQRPRPVVLHAPSKRWTKGTGRILPILTDLHERGAIELALAENVPHTDMRGWIHNADIVVDQLGTGAYGTLAVEAMAAGKPVLAYLSDAFDKVMPQRPPIINTIPKTLSDNIEQLIDDRERAIHIGAESITYARDYHDGQRTARTLSTFLTT